MVSMEWITKKIRIVHRKYMKHIVTNIEATKEPSSFKFPSLGDYILDSDFGNFVFEVCLILEYQQSKNSKQHIIFQEAYSGIDDEHNMDIIFGVDNIQTIFI